MPTFMDEDFLLHTSSQPRVVDSGAKALYNEVRALPIVDFHCHINPRDIAEDRLFTDISELWFGGDHYKWRLLRQCGTPERLVTGDGSGWEKFAAFAAALPRAIGNPLYHWAHLELKAYFGWDKLLSPATAAECYAHCGAILARGEMSAKELIRRSRVELICTTDDPDDDLRWHEQIAQDDSFPTRVLPAFRPDRLLADPGGRGEAELLRHLEGRLDFFADHGCKFSDHGLTDVNGNHELLIRLGGMYKDRDIVMQIHFGPLRNISRRALASLGRDAGYDVIGDANCASGLASLLDEMDSRGALPKMILYSINENDNAVVSAIAGSFPGVRQGSAWWFGDTKPGMEAQLRTLAATSALGTFPGMVTDSRSLLSYPRHDYFRRILCGFVGSLVDAGEAPFDMAMLAPLARGICYQNIKDFAGV